MHQRTFGHPSLVVQGPPRILLCSRTMQRSPVVALAVALAVTACGSKDSISLSANVSNVQLTVTEKTLGTELLGSFDLYLEVGPEADGAASVELEAFSLVAAGSGAALVPSLNAVPQGATFPLTIGKGESKTIPFQLDTSKLLPSGEKANLCAGQVRVVGAVKHSLNGGETKPLESTPQTLGGC